MWVVVARSSTSGSSMTTQSNPCSSVRRVTVVPDSGAATRSSSSISRTSAANCPASISLKQTPARPVGEDAQPGLQGHRRPADREERVEVRALGRALAPQDVEQAHPGS